jgi:glucose-6-phosphate dehydrogenase assembly protein OpcA
MAAAVIAGAPPWRPASPDTVDDDLAALWRDLAREGPLSRAILSNLVIFDPAGRSRPSRALLAEIAKRHPARVVLLDYASGVAAPCAPDAISVGVLTFGAAGSRYGVEVIAVHSACAEASVASVVRRLIRGDVPTMLWCIGDLSQAVPSTAMTELGRQIVYDSAAWRDAGKGLRAAAAMLAATPSIDLADLSWRRLRPLRRALALAAAGTKLGPTDVRVTYQPAQAALGWLAAGWLMNRLGPGPGGGPHLVQAPATDGPLLHVAIDGGAWTLSAALTSEAASARHSASAMPLTIPAPAETEAEAVAAELHAIGENRMLRDAMREMAPRLLETRSPPPPRTAE